MQGSVCCMVVCEGARRHVSRGKGTTCDPDRSPESMLVGRGGGGWDSAHTERFRASMRFLVARWDEEVRTFRPSFLPSPARQHSVHTCMRGANSRSAQSGVQRCCKHDCSCLLPEGEGWWVSNSCRLLLELSGLRRDGLSCIAFVFQRAANRVIT